MIEGNDLEYTEKQTNIFNLKAIAIVTAAVLFLWVLNLLNIFIVDQKLFVGAVISTIAIVLITVLASLIAGLNNPITKLIILAGTVLIFSAVYVYITYHAIISLFFPLIFAALYRKKWVLWYTYGFMVVGIFASTLLAYNAGLADANVILTTQGTTADFIEHFEKYTPVEGFPAMQLLLFYAFPRCAAIAAVIPVMSHITDVIDKRTTKLIEEQRNYIELSRKQQSTQHNVIVSLSSLIESRDGITGDHVHRTEVFVKFLTEKLIERGSFKDQLTKEYADLTVDASPLHDVGKIKVPDAVLCKPGKLTDEEYAEIKKHSQYGRDIMNMIVGGMQDHEYLEIATQMALYHHERYDGKGYPFGITGERIPLCARIMSVADVLDALLSKRQYKEPFTLEKTRQIMEEEKGKQFDPVVLDALLDNWEEFKTIL